MVDTTGLSSQSGDAQLSRYMTQGQSQTLWDPTTPQLNKSATIIAINTDATAFNVAWILDPDVTRPSSHEDAVEICT